MPANGKWDLIRRLKVKALQLFCACNMHGTTFKCIREVQKDEISREMQKKIGGTYYVDLEGRCELLP